MTTLSPESCSRRDVNYDSVDMYMMMSQTCCSEYTIHHDLFEAGDGLVDGLRDEDALAGCETACFEHDVEST